MSGEVTRLVALAAQVVEACNQIIELKGETMAEKRTALERSLHFIATRRDQCWAEIDEQDIDDDLIGDDEDLI